MQAALRESAGPYLYVRFDGTGAEEIVEAHPERWGDAVIVRKEIPTSYHLSVVVDDALQGVTHVVRGQDLEAATDLHVLLQRLLGLPTPRYHHHGLIRDPAGDKLSKSLGSESLADLRARGVTADEVYQRLGFTAQPTPRI
jgi:glutamyl-Q tRNA(Asp) synthetase